MIQKHILLLNKEVEATKLQCPHCNNGKLRLNKADLIRKQYQSNINFMEENYENNSSLFEKSIVAGILTCSNLDCKEYVSFMGEIFVKEVEIEDEVYDVDTIDMYNLYPMVHLIPIHIEYPKEIQELLVESFELYLKHPSSCVNKLRILVEKILDDLAVPEEKTAGLRINNHLQPINPKVADYLTALKWVGNEGSHDTVIKQSDLPEIYSILHKVLDLIYLKSDETLDYIVDTINEKKGLHS